MQYTNFYVTNTNFYIFFQKRTQTSLHFTFADIKTLRKLLFTSKTSLHSPFHKQNSAKKIYSTRSQFLKAQKHS